LLVLNAQEIKDIFTMREAIESDREALVIQAENNAQVPVRVNFDVCQGGTTSFMPALIKKYPQAGIKIVSTYTRNAGTNLPVTTGSVILIDHETGFVNAILDGTEITKMRTGAIAGLAAELLANPGSEIGALFGTGGQGLSQLEAMLTVRKLKEVRVYDINRSYLTAFIEKASPIADAFSAKLVAAESSDEAINDADVITCVTTTTVPVFDGNKVKAGAHINGVGTFMPFKRELDETIIKRADRIFIDNKEACMSEAGDLIIPINEGKLKEQDIAGELGDLILGKVEGRSSEKQITIMKTVGFATLDIVIAYKIYQKAIEKGIGKKV
jgi:ornithine cyclodeaminase